MKRTEKTTLTFRKGLRDGIPICLGYISVSFTFGMMVVESGLPSWVGTLISMTNLTSAGQFAGLSIILAGSSLIELAITTLIINIRYLLMSFALSQKIEKNLSFAVRCGIALGITDEIFAVSMQQEKEISPRYFAGLLLTPYAGWAFGTVLGGIAADLLPLSVRSALGIAIYGMFLAIIIPPARKSRAVLLAISIAAGMNCLFYYVPFINRLSSGWSIIICAVTASAVCALLFPVKEEEKEQESP